MMGGMFQGLPDSIGSDCCGEDHGDWQFENVTTPKGGRPNITWLCSGCGITAYTEAYQDRNARWLYPDPCGNITEPTAHNRPRRR